MFGQVWPCSESLHSLPSQVDLFCVPCFLLSGAHREGPKVQQNHCLFSIFSPSIVSCAALAAFRVPIFHFDEFCIFFAFLSHCHTMSRASSSLPHQFMAIIS